MFLGRVALKIKCEDKHLFLVIFYQNNCCSCSCLIATIVTFKKMDIEVDVANISLQDKPTRTPTVLGNSFQNDRGQKASTGSESDRDPAIRDKFMQLVTKARQLTENGDIAQAIKLNEEALSLHFSDKLQKRIAKMKAFLVEQDKNDVDNEDEGQMKCLGQGFMLHASLFQKIYSHQKEGVLWMWSLFRLGKGGILADDMGLGKTIQVIAFLAGLFDMNKIKSVMIVVPLSVLPNWLDEFNRWAPGINVMQFHGSSKKEKERALARVRTRGGVLMTTYGLVITTKETFSERHGQEFVWDYVILDEGHKIKNPTKTSKSIHQIPAKHRLILTGTPVQNNLKELWSLFDYVQQGSLLGTVRTFKIEFETPIIRARERDATAVEKKLGQEMAQILKTIIQPYFLRRTKAEVGKNSDKEDSKEQCQMPTLTRKNDLVIWLHLTETQQQIYQDFVSLDQVKELLMTKKSPLVALTVLKKICDHPRLLSARACLQLGLDGESFNEEDLEQPESYECAATQIHKIPDETLIQESGKMQILVELLDAFKSEGHRTLVFSQSRKLLDIIQKVITNRGHKVARLDGTIGQVAERGKIVKKFQSDNSYTVFLLTIQVGGVGLTITTADRVIIYDPNWNPATDAQAVDRAYRIGQVKNVVVYRLITCGTVEEKIYRRQVFKDSITRQTTGGNSNPYRYFTKMELKELFTLDDPKFSKTQRQLQTMHGNQRESDTALDEHIAFLHSLDIFGISDHDLMFKQTSTRDDEDDDVEMVPGGEGDVYNDAHFIEHKVRNAQKLIAEESTNCLPYEQRSKGAMRYPPSSATNAAPGLPRPTPLFTNVEDTQHSESTSETSNEDMIGQGSDKSSHEVIDLTEPSDEDSTPERFAQKKHLKSPSKKAAPGSITNSPIKHESERKVLQPLSHKEIQQRSPRTSTLARAGEIIAEELLISPDTHNPIMSLEKISSLKKSARDISAVKLSLSFHNSHSNSGSPSKDDRNSSMMSERISPIKNFQGSAFKNLLKIGATSTPQSSDGIFVRDTPNSTGKSSNASDISISSPHRNSLDASQMFRKLSFVVPDSDKSVDASVDESPCPVIRKKHKSHTSIASPGSDSQLSTRDNDESVMETACGDASRMSVAGSDERMVMLINKSKTARSLQEDFDESDDKNDSYINIINSNTGCSNAEEEAARKATSNKRRSVCLQRRLESDDDGSKDSQILTVDNSSEEEEESVENESDEDDKENVPVSVKNAGGRRRIVSDSESEEGSCFEVEESEEEAKPSQERLVPKVEEEEQKIGQEEDTNQAESGGSHDDVEDNDADEEENEIFQNLIAVARSLYKEKNFEESLLHVEKALAIFYDPDLEDMAKKIRARVQAKQN